MEDKWIFDKCANELINLKNCRCVWIFSDKEATESNSADHRLSFAFTSGTNQWLTYESSEILINAFENYKFLLNCTDMDATHKPLTL